MTIAVALISALSGLPVRHDVAMTGEITLRGRVLPVGGVKEKVLGAHRNKIQEVFLPARNFGDLHEIPPAVRRKMKLTTVRHTDQPVEMALLQKPQAAEAGTG